MRKFLAIIIAFSFVLSISCVAYAADNSGTCGNNLTWSYSNKTLEIIGTGDMTDFSSNDEKPWDSVGEIASIIIGAGVSSVGTYAFSNTTASSVTIKADNIEIKNHAFYNSSIKDITAEENIASIEQFAFAECSSLQHLYLNSVSFINNNAFFNSNNIENIVFDGTTAPSISPYAFVDITTMISFTSSQSWNALPKTNYGGNLTWNNGRYFGTCGDGMTWEISSGVLTISGNGNIESTGISNNTWKSLSENILEIVINNGCIEIGDFAFYGLTNVEKISTPESLKKIGRSSFENCSKLTEVNLAVGLEIIDVCAFTNCSSIEEISIPKTVNNISKYAFMGCKKLETISFLGEDVPTISNSALQGLTTTCYHRDNDEWAKATSNNYGGNITWDILQITEKQYKVIFVDYDGTQISEQMVNEGANATPPEDPEKEDAEFFGWSGNYHNIKKDETVIATYDDDENVFKIETAKGKVGDEVTVLVDIDGAVNVCAFDITLYYDSALELVSYDDDMDLDIVINADALDHGIIFNYSNAKNKTKQRDIVELTFRIKDTTKKELPIKFNIKDVNKVVDEKLVDANYKYVNGVIKVQ